KPWFWTVLKYTVSDVVDADRVIVKTSVPTPSLTVVDAGVIVKAIGDPPAP
ncbi:MAG: hypothetical protein IT555_18900, partial [Acetobacteraceae bacterium]|nr:hypothetical protein [Acetobacteraceae bacterium]